MRKLSLFVAITGLALCGIGLANMATAGAWNGHKITLCHRTDSRTNPYVQVTVDVASVQFAGHEGHKGPLFNVNLPKLTKWGDIIPPKTDDGQIGVVPKNWPAGATLLRNKCKLPTPPTTTTTVPQETTSTTVPQETTSTTVPEETTSTTMPEETTSTTVKQGSTTTIIGTPTSVSKPPGAPGVPVGTTNLPRTGSGSTPLAVAGGALVGLGSLGMLFRRRRAL